ncbi:thioredoxin family protein [candidate division NPL-UPA2 bacterium]|nr:thioredoxin family protein [candidate division NPL-UPA2 bacterium]
MEIKIFGKKNCAKCQTTKNKLHFFLKKWDIGDKIKVSFYDMDTVEGLSEGAFYGVGKIPTTILENGGREMVRWTEKVPKSEDLKKYLMGESKG